jgi:hypothetical protein
MSHFYLQRPSLLWVAFLLAFLLSCAGGGNNIVNGFGGTGKFARISDLGRDGVNDTMTVDGIKYTTNTAIFIRDGIVIKEQSDFNLGEIVTVEGIINPDGKTGVATKIIFDDALEGPVTKEGEASFIEVLGQRIDIDNDTLFHGFDNLADLRKAHRVEISGFVRKNRSILATSIRLIATSDRFLDITGYISRLDKAEKIFQINNLVVDYSRVLVPLGENPFENGFYVEVFSRFPLRDDLMTASEVRVLSQGVFKPNTYYQIGGTISRFDSITDFDVYGLPISTNSQTLLSRSAGVVGALDKVGINKTVIVNGHTNKKGVLAADELTFISDSSKLSMTGFIESIDIENKTVAVFGVTFLLDELISSIKDKKGDDSTREMNFKDFIVGDYIFLESYRKTNNEHIIWELQRTPFDLLGTFDLSMKGVVFGSDETLGVIDLIEHHIETDSNTSYIDISNKAISKQAFFSQILTKNISLLIYGEKTGEKTIKADLISIEGNRE